MLTLQRNELQWRSIFHSAAHLRMPTFCLGILFLSKQLATDVIRTQWNVHLQSCCFSCTALHNLQNKNELSKMQKRCLQKNTILLKKVKDSAGCYIGL